MKNKESRKKITVILESSLVEKIEYTMSVLKISTYNAVLKTALIQGYSIDQLFEYAKSKSDGKTNVNNSMIMYK